MSKQGTPIPPRPDLRGPVQVASRQRRRAPIAMAVAFTLALLPALGVTVLATRADRVAADGGSYVFLEQAAAGRPLRWNPCEPIRYQVNLANAPEDALQIVEEALRRTTEVTGIGFRFDGTTSRTPAEQRDDFFMSQMSDVVWYPVLVAWLPREEFREAFERPHSGRHALAVAYVTRGEDLETADQYTSGYIVVDADARMSPDFDGRYSLGLVLMHEVGHVMGLGHVDDPDELMFSDRDGYPYPIWDWGPGDRAGLERLGQGGCTDPVPVAP